MVDPLTRQFKADGPDQLWVADITYIPAWSGFLYLAIVLDVWSRKIVGWAMRTRLRTELVLEALNTALMQRRPNQIIHHSDDGWHNTSDAFGKRFREMNVMLTCLTVNSRNSFGGYTGDQQAMLLKDEGQWHIISIYDISHQLCIETAKKVIRY